MDDTFKQLRAEAFPLEERETGCSICNSFFHEDKDCPKSKQDEPKFRFKSRKEMNLEPGSLPFKFRVDIDSRYDDETEIIRKRALLRLNASKVYNLMGVSVKAQESQKAAVQWLIQLANELDIDDEALQKERSQLLPLIQTMQTSLQALTRIREEKIQQAVAMEEFVTTSRQKARQVRTRLAKMKIRNNSEEMGTIRLPDSDIDIPVLFDEDMSPINLIKEASEAIMEKEKSKHSDPEIED